MTIYLDSMAEAGQAGNVVARLAHLTGRRSNARGRPSLEHVGKQFGPWLVLRRVPGRARGYVLWLAQCTRCGETRVMRSDNLQAREGGTKCRRCGERQTLPWARCA